MMIKMPKGYTSNSTTLFSLLLLMVPVIAFDLANLYHPKVIRIRSSLLLSGV